MTTPPGSAKGYVSAREVVRKSTLSRLQSGAGTPGAVLRGAMPPARRFGWALAAGFASEASAVALLAVSAWLIVRASEQPPVLYLSAAVVGVRFFAISRASFRYLERLTGHDAALRQLSSTRADLVRRLVPLAPDGLARTRRGSVLGALVDDVDELQNLPLRVVQPLVSSALVALGAVVLVAFVWWPAALTLLACLVVAAAIATLWGWMSGARAERDIAPLRAALADAVLDHIGSLDVLAAFGAEAQSRERIARGRRRPAPRRGPSLRSPGGNHGPRLAAGRRRVDRGGAGRGAGRGIRRAQRTVARRGRAGADGRVRGVRRRADGRLGLAAGAGLGGARRRRAARDAAGRARARVHPGHGRCSGAGRRHPAAGGGRALAGRGAGIAPRHRPRDPARRARAGHRRERGGKEHARARPGAVPRHGRRLRHRAPDRCTTCRPTTCG